MTKEEREMAIEHTMDIVSDLVPYDTPNYWEKVREMAESIVDNPIEEPSHFNPDRYGYKTT